jgi:hypothetical protein
MSFKRSEFGVHIVAYKEAGDRLVRDLSNDSSFQRELLLPISSLYRQFIELSLKDLIFIGNQLLDEPLQWSDDRSRQAGFPITHDLKHLLKTWRQVWDKLDGQSALLDMPDLPFDLLEKYIEDFFSGDIVVDPFRYPNDTGGRAFFPERYYQGFSPKSTLSI